MRLTIPTLLLPALSFVSATTHTVYPWAARRDLLDDLVARQSQATFPPNLTEAQAEAAYQAQCSATTSDIGKSLIQQDIANATANSIAISASFQDILNKLRTIDSENLNGGKQFAPTWNAIAQNWTNILWASRTTASDTAAYTEEFTTVIMPFVTNQMGPIPVDVSVEVLDQYKDMAAQLGAGAQATAQSFTDIINAINAFTATFQGFAAAQKSADQQSIDQLNAQIQTLQGKIAAFNTQITGLAIALGATALGTVGGVALFPAFAPFILFFGLSAAIGEATALGVIEKQRSDAQNQLNSAQSQVANLQHQLDQIAAANATLHGITVATQTMDTQLGAFRDVWTAVAEDCVSVGQYLNTTSTIISGPVIIRQPLIYWATMKKVDCVYQAITDGLQDYAIGITNSGLPPPTSRRGLNFKDKLHADVQALISKAQAEAHARHTHGGH